MKQNKISVIIPSYKRPKELEKCLIGLKNQKRQADEIIVIYRNNDFKTKKLIKKKQKQIPNLNHKEVKKPGQIEALNRGLETVRGDIIAFTDDDAVPHTDWLKRIEKYFISDKKIGGVGGKDIIYTKRKKEKKNYKIVGKVQWFGRMIGNHHLYKNSTCEVDILKGVNMSFRKKAIKNLKFDKRLLGKGAQVHNELYLCLKLKKSGWKIIYDPKILVDHYISQRFDEDKRNQFNKNAFKNAVHNETLSLLEYFSFLQRTIFLLWAFFVGTRKAFGIIQLFRFLPKEKKIALTKWIASMEGHWQGIKTFNKSKNENSNNS